MDSPGREIINQFQGDLPLVKRPYAAMAEELGTEERIIIDSIKKLRANNYLSRFGPLYNADCLGGGLTLAAISAPEEDFLAVSHLINTLPQVAHNYRRDHSLNMWFVLATETPEEIKDCLDSVEQLTGLPVYSFPKLKEYYLGLKLYINSESRVSTCSFSIRDTKSGYQLKDPDRAIIRATQEGLALVPEPYEQIARQTGLSPKLVISRLQTMLDHGVIRRIGAVPNHYRLGLKHNGMSVWNVNDDRVDELGQLTGQMDFVSHCYLRPRHKNIWPYNLFAMVHGGSRAEVIEKSELISRLLGDQCQQSEILFSSAILKKTGLRLVA